MTPEQEKARARAQARLKAKAALEKGEIFPEGPLRVFDDMTTAAMNMVHRGFGTKIFGEDAQRQEKEAIERTPAAARIPAQVAGAVAGMPYRVAGMGAGAVAGGLEGAASAYGNQEGWVPDLGEIGKSAATGAALGSGGAKLGEWLGKGWSALTGGGRTPNPQAGDPNLLGKVGKVVEPLSLGHRKTWRNFPQIAGAEWVLGHLGVPPGVTTAGATALNWAGRTGLGRQSATMADPRVSEAARDAFARMMIATGNRP